MKTELHSLLREQLKRDLGVEEVPDHLKHFIHSINSAYFQFDKDQHHLEETLQSSLKEHQKKTLELKTMQEQLVNLVETIPQGIVIIDCKGKIEFANTGTERILGLPRRRLINRTYNDPVWRMHSSQPANEEFPLELILKTKEPISGIEYAITNLTGEERTLNVNAAPLHDGKGNITGIVASLEDITLRKQMEAQLKYLSLHDALTGLYNRTFFEEEMLRLSTGLYNPVGIIICDIDGLKLVNDTLGHEQGDKLLLSAAGIIKSCFNDKAVVARIGGDEFAILLAGTSKTELETYCFSLREAADSYHALQEEGTLPFSISVGFALSNDSIVNMADLYREADNNMYREKLHHQQSIRSAIVQTLVKAMEARDFCTEGHADRMQDLAEDLANAIGFPEMKIPDLRLLAHFHDIGKVGIPDRILFKAGPLTNEESLEMRRHCEIGHRIAHSAADLVLISDWILKHHEWWNGEGYPLGLKGEDIPLECRILAIVDAFDAMTSDRPYRKALSTQQAAQELLRCAGVQFDPVLVNHFLEIINYTEK